MPATTPNPNKAVADSNGNGRGYNAPSYVDLSLTTEQKAHLAQWIDETEWADLEKWLQHMVEDGHIISIKRMTAAAPDRMVDGYLVSVTGTKYTGTHIDKCLTARASTAIKALFSAMYRDEVLLHGVWSTVEKRLDLDV